MQKTTGKRLVFEILFALLLLFLLVAILVTEISRTKDAFFYERADLTPYIRTEALTGYIFRNEIAPVTLNPGPIDYRVANGASVKAGEPLAHVYRDDTGLDKRERAAVLYAQIEEIEAALALPDWKTAFVEDYTALMRELSAQNTAAAIAPAQATAAAIGGRDAQTNKDALNTRLAALREELNALTAHTSDYLTTKADADAVFYHTADGYEALFGVNQIENLTPTALDTLLAASPKQDGVIGKLVLPGSWYFVVPLERAQAETYEKGTAYPVHFAEGSAIMTLDRIHIDETDRALLIFRGEESPKWLSVARRQSVTVEKGCVTGLCVPADAISQDNTVFVLQDGVARLRHVTPVLRENGCVLVAADEENGIVAGERVIVSAKQLFDGKVLQ